MVVVPTRPGPLPTYIGSCEKGMNPVLKTVTAETDGPSNPFVVYEYSSV